MDVELSVSQFVASLNQTLEYAYNRLIVVGEIADLRVSRGQWLYFDLRDEASSIKCFGTVAMLPGPLENGMMAKVYGAPRLHPRYGFSFNVVSIQPVGEGSIVRAAQLLEAKLAREGLFAPERKRPLLFPPQSVGLITSEHSAAYADFMKVLNGRWGGLEITLIDVQVQGEAAPAEIIAALDKFNQMARPPDVLVITRGGGSAQDLLTFSDERVVRAVSASRIPSLVAIGHEIDESLAELAADARASTPSNAAELLVPDKRAIGRQLHSVAGLLADLAGRQLDLSEQAWRRNLESIGQSVGFALAASRRELAGRDRLLHALNPRLPLERGYALVRDVSGRLVRKASDISRNAKISVEISDAELAARVERIDAKK